MRVTLRHWGLPCKASMGWCVGWRESKSQHQRLVFVVSWVQSPTLKTIGGSREESCGRGGAKSNALQWRLLLHITHPAHIIITRHQRTRRQLGFEPRSKYWASMPNQVLPQVLLEAKCWAQEFLSPGSLESRWDPFGIRQKGAWLRTNTDIPGYLQQCQQTNIYWTTCWELFQASHRHGLTCSS